MNRSAISALFIKDLRELMRSRYGVMLVVLFFIFLGVFVYMVRAFPYAELLMKDSGDVMVISAIGPLAFVLPLVLFLQALFVEEKLSGTVQALILAPLKPSEILFTKSILSAVISSIFMGALSLAMMFLFNGAIALPLLVFLFPLLPLLVFSLSSIMGYLALGRWKSSVAIMVGVVMMVVVIQANVWIPMRFPASQSVLPVFYAVLTVILLPVSIVMGRRLTRDDVMRVV